MRSLKQVIDSDANERVYMNPDNIGNNGFWNVRTTEPDFGGDNVVEIKMCIPHSGAVSYLDYFACPATCVEYKDVVCDFSTLVPGVPLTNGDQAEKLRDTCSMSVRPRNTMPGKVYTDPPINVFDSLHGVHGRHARDDPDLGAPNRACGPILPHGQTGPGRGRGGQPLLRVMDNGTWIDNPYKNCDPLGNLLIIQNGDIRVEEKANDSPFGGCMDFEFHGMDNVTLIDFGLLDMEEAVEITLYLDGVPVGPTLVSPVAGDNGYWVASSSYGNGNNRLLPSPTIDSMSICSFGSGAVSFIHFSACPK
jgi:hypothetical protein